MRVSGNAYYTTITAPTYEGVVDEDIRVGIVLYYRSPQLVGCDLCERNEGESFTHRYGDKAPFDVLGGAPLCPDLVALAAQTDDTFRAHRDELLDGVPTNHFSDEGPVGPVGRVGDLPEGLVSDKLEFWTDYETGQLVQVVMETTYHDRRRENGPVLERMQRWTITFSGVGEPNVITAPTLGGG